MYIDILCILAFHTINICWRPPPLLNISLSKHQCTLAFQSLHYTRGPPFKMRQWNLLHVFRSSWLAQTGRRSNRTEVDFPVLLRTTHGCDLETKQLPTIEVNERLKSGFPLLTHSPAKQGSQYCCVYDAFQ